MNLNLLLDVHLSRMPGHDLQPRLRSEGSTIPVIVITAFDVPSAVNRPNV
jgi:FixJ family two-component response regulator